MITNKNGIFGELYANRFLRDKGYDILCTNYRTRRGEIDIVARDNNSTDKRGKPTVFVEVKALSDTTLILPREKVNLEKQKRILSAAQTFIVTYKIDTPIRFDVIEIYLDGKEIPGADNIVHFEAAF